ncbi:MAG: hypothetical protein LUO98_01600, partial [Methanoregula sp.]|nr:hypothetical protein [Methanoregula sp.]
EDIREAARVIKGHKVHPYVRMIVVPATQAVYKQCIKEGLSTSLSMRAPPSAHRRAGHAWAATWASLQQASAP